MCTYLKYHLGEIVGSGSVESIRQLPEQDGYLRGELVEHGVDEGEYGLSDDKVHEALYVLDIMLLYRQQDVLVRDRYEKRDTLESNKLITMQYSYPPWK